MPVKRDEELRPPSLLTGPAPRILDWRGGLSSKRALGGRGPFLSEPTFIPYDVIRILQGLR